MLTWHDLGGSLISTPTGVTYSGFTWFVGEQADHTLWVRSLGIGWHRLAPTTLRCRQPSVAHYGSTLELACLSSSGTVLYGIAGLHVGRLPAFSRLTSLGGHSIYGATMMRVGTTLTFVGVGSDHRVISRTLTTGWTAHGLTCASPPSAGFAKGYASWVGCRGPSADAQLSRVTYGGWSSPVSLAIQTTGQFGVDVTPAGLLAVYLRVNAGDIWSRMLQSAYSTFGRAGAGGVTVTEV
jgi:hypothetical protein